MSNLAEKPIITSYTVGLDETTDSLSKRLRISTTATVVIGFVILSICILSIFKLPGLLAFELADHRTTSQQAVIPPHPSSTTTGASQKSEENEPLLTENATQEPQSLDEQTPDNTSQQNTRERSQSLPPKPQPPQEQNSKHQDETKTSSPRQEQSTATLNLSASSFLVTNLSNNEEVLSKNTSKQLQIASLTKLLTAIVTADTFQAEDEYTISKQDVLNVSPTLDLEEGDSVKIYDLIAAMIVGSENDAALALSHAYEAKTGKDFISTMNVTAQNLGMTHSKFYSPHGLSQPGNISTATDLNKLTTTFLSRSDFSKLGKLSSYRFTSKTGKTFSSVTTNKLLYVVPNLIAVKTGYTDQARGQMITRYSTEHAEYLLIVLHSEIREKDTQKIITYLKEHG